MTGYGGAEFTSGKDAGPGYTIEVKSLNHRYLDINIRMPEGFNPIEARIRDCIKKNFSRGAFSVYVNSKGCAAGELRLNLPVAAAYVKAAGALKKKLHVKGDVDAAELLRLKDVFAFSGGGGIDVEKDWKGLAAALKKALLGVSSMRKKEGSSLKKDVEEKLEGIERLLANIERRVPGVVGLYRERLRQEIRTLLEGHDVEESRILTEAAIFADRTNVSEEISRFKSHLSEFRRYLGLKEPIGRRLDFLCQEILREANTMGSKSPDTGITQAVVEIKGEIEKVREQVQNIE